MTEALSCYGLEGGEIVGVVNERRGITVLYPQMEFSSVSLGAVYLTVHSHALLFSILPNSLTPKSFYFCPEDCLFYNGHWKMSGKV